MSVSASKNPTRLGRYEILDEIGKGAMGVVLLAKDPLIGRLVALKTFRLGYSVRDQELEQFRVRFMREAQSAGILSHPNIVTIHDVSEDGGEGIAFIAMEYVRGTNLKLLLQRESGLDLAFVAGILEQLADGLDYAHSKGVVHRDVKPANIIITADNRAKITDFGIARIDTSNLTQEGQLLGTPNYMAPEQILGRDVDHRSDLFSLGVVLYEMLTRHKPFQGENLTVVSHRIVYDHFTPPVEFVKDLPAGVEPILTRALQKDPNRRYQRAREMASDLSRLVSTRMASEALNETVSMPAGSPPAPGPGSAAGEGTGGGTGGTGGAGSGTGTGAGSESGVGSESASGSSGMVGDATQPGLAVAGDATGGLPPALPATVALPLASFAASPPPEPPPPSELPTTETDAPAPAKPPLTAPPPPIPPVVAAVAPPAPPPLPVPAASPPAAAPIRPAQPTGSRRSAPLVLALLGFVVLAGLAAGGWMLWQRHLAQKAAAAAAAAAALQPPPPPPPVQQPTENPAVAEAALKAARDRQIADTLEQARQALAGKRYDEAAAGASAVLSLVPDQPDAKALLAAVEKEKEKAGIKKRDRIAAQAKAAQAAQTVPAAAPSPAAVAAPAPVAPAQPLPTDATLSVRFFTNLPEGILVVYANNSQVVREPFKFRKKTGFLRSEPSKGQVRQDIKIQAGTADIRVYVTYDNKRTDVRQLSGNFPGGSQRTLSATLNEDGSLTARLE